MEIDSALHELYQLNNLTNNPLDCPDDKVKEKCPARSQSPCETSSSTMELDSALHKLGMLSSVTNSRLNYIEEKAKKKRSSHSLSSAPLCVVQMNPNFIKKFSLSKKSSASAESESDEEEASFPRESFTSHRKLRRRMRRSQNMPYYKTDLIRSLKCSSVPVGTVYVLPQEKASPSVSRQDSGNKSNPSSPVKSQISLTSQGSSLTRSRSLDDLEIIDCPPDCCCPYTAVRTDIDTVSQSISQLHVS